MRAMIYYPLTTGRNMVEIMRVVQALQTTDQHGVATPANWQPGRWSSCPRPRPLKQRKRGSKRALSARTGTFVRKSFKEAPWAASMWTVP
jgi:peroxiredoxin (alkyl hydroperoxide reductase subunit C)